MKSVRIPLIVLTLAMLLGGQPPRAEAWSLADLNPFAKKKSESPQQQIKAPSPWQKIDSGAKSFATRTKNALTPKKKNNPSLWAQQSARSKKKNPFWSSWFKPKQAEAPKTMKDWWKLKRPDH